MRVHGREINDECQYCGKVLQCELSKLGHGIGIERQRIADLIKCQLEHRQNRIDANTDGM